MIKLIGIFIVLIASVWIGLHLSAESGYVLITLGQWSVETTLPVAIISLFLLFFTLYFLMAFIRKIIHIPQFFKNWRQKRNKKKAHAKTRQGLIEFSEGYWKKAENHLIQALPGSDAPLLNYLTAARAAQEMGDSQLRDHYLREAQQSMPEAKVAVELTQAQLQLANNQWEQALATLKHLQKIAPRHPYVLKLLMNLYEQVRDWPQLLQLLPELKRNQVLNDAEFQRKQQNAFIQAMHDYLKHEHYEAIETLFSGRPKTLIYDPEIVTVYSQVLIKQEKYQAAETLIRRTLSKRFDEQLASQYGELGGLGAKLVFVENLLKNQSHSSALLLSAGKIAVKENLWGKARAYFEKSIGYRPSPQAYYELGCLLEQLNDQDNAIVAFKKGAALSCTHKNVWQRSSQ